MRGIVTLLLLLLLVQTGGQVLVLVLQQQQVRREMKQRIKAGVSEEDLVHLAIAKSLEQGRNARFQRIHEREFRFDGEMYDIVRSEERGDTTLYVCIHDVQETALFANLHALIRNEMNHNPERQRQSRLAQRLLDTLFLVNAAEFPDIPTAGTEPAPALVEAPLSRSILPITPPPEFHSISSSC